MSLVRSFFLLIIFFSCRSVLAQSSPEQSRVIPARTMPVPDTVSPQMRKLIAPGPSPRDAPQSAEEWKALVAQASRVEMTRIAQLRRHFDVEVTERTIAGVRCYEVTPKTISSEES